VKPSGPEKPPARTLVRLEIAPQAIGWVLATIAGVWLLAQLWVILLLVLVALVFVGTFNPLVKWLERRGISRTLALVLLFLSSMSVALLLLFLTVPPLVDQVTAIVKGLPAAREELIGLLALRPTMAPLARALQGGGLEQGFARLESQLLGYSTTAVVVVSYFATTVVLSFYFLADGKRTQGALYAILPRTYHMRLARIIQNLETIVGGYMRGQIITSAGIGVFTYVLLVVCGVPNALSLALFAAVTDVIPFVGGLLAAAPAVLSALPRGLPVAATVAIAMFIYMEFETRILVPRVYGSALRLTPSVVVLALLTGGLLLGVMGALLALPMAAGLRMILEELRVELPGDDSDNRSARARYARTEATYERMSAGTTAPEAGHIASELAHDLRVADDEAARAAVKGTEP
jgi:predicted PurR-regulated permease PerM